MITFDDLKINPNDQTAFFLPMRLRIMLTNEMNRQGVKINRKLISYREIMNSPELSQKYRPDQEAAHKAFVECGCEDAMEPEFYDMLITDVDPKALFEKLKLFYGDTIDPDYAFWKAAEGKAVPVEEEADEAENMSD
jgi:hypothetical protein